MQANNALSTGLISIIVEFVLVQVTTHDRGYHFYIGEKFD
jgi:hypothetical protein